MRHGQEVIVLNGKGQEYVVKLVIDENGQVSGRIKSRRQAMGEPVVRLVLYLSLTQREKFEWMLQKCTEVGAAAIVPFISSRCLIQDQHDAGRKLDRWRKIVLEAAEQSGRGIVPDVQDPVMFPQAVQQAHDGSALALIAYESEQQQQLRQVLAGQHPDRVALLIGPEGGFSEEEIALAKASGLVSVGLGQRILRMETAAIVGSALVLYELEAA
jgi:16S rRNA (uracil1498-N3)-methyltransferase